MADAQGIAADRLRSFVERIENLESEKAEIAGAIKEVKAEARSAGFDVKTINALVKRRKLTPEERDEQDAMLETYEHAIGQLKGTPLDTAARDRAGLTVARDDLKSQVDNLTKEPGASISVTAAGITTTLKNVGGTRVLEQTGEPPTDMGPPPKRTIGSAIDAIKRGHLGTQAAPA